VDFSPYGQSVFADAVDAVQSVDLAYDALINEVDAGKMRVFLSDVMFDQERTADGRRVPIPFGKGDCTVFRKVMSTEDTIQEFAPALRTEAQGKAFRLALQVLGDLCGLGVNYFDLDNVGYVKTATEVSSDNSALMRNIRKHENALACAIKRIVHASLHFAREFLGESLPPEGEVTVTFDDSIVTDTASEKAQDMAELNVTMNPWEYRMKWYGEDEETAKSNVPRGSAFVPDDPFAE
jgi:A118 family predicted phage portal protein